jgi:hypothetical protein
VSDLFEVFTNIPDYVRFFERVVVQLGNTEGSAVKNRSVRFKLNLVNDAKTLGKNGEQFEYFEAVDTGRKAIRAAEGKFLIFAYKTPQILEAEGVRATFPGARITERSIGEVQADFPTQIEENVRSWVATGVTIIAQGGKTPVVNMDETAGEIAGQLFRKSKVVLDADRIVKQELSVLGDTSGKSFPSLQSQDYSPIKKLIRAANLGVTGAIVLSSAEFQAETFRENTPSREDTGNFKLILQNGPPIILDPATGGLLKKSYKYTLEGDFDLLIAAF